MPHVTPPTSQRPIRTTSHASQVEQDFNLREGLQRKDDTLPVRFKDHPIPDGPAEGTTINIDRLADCYYDVKGWEKKRRSEQKTGDGDQMTPPPVFF